MRRILPAPSDDPSIQAYYEFLEFFKVTKLYTIQYRLPADYAKLLTYLGKKPGEAWTEAEIRTFKAYFQYFQDAFSALNTRGEDVLPEEALLHWLQLYPYTDLGKLTAPELKKTLASVWKDVLSSSHPEEVKVETTVEIDKPGILSRIISPAPDHLNIAFVHQLSPASSGWVLGHEEGA